MSCAGRIHLALSQFCYIILLSRYICIHTQLYTCMLFRVKLNYIMPYIMLCHVIFYSCHILLDRVVSLYQSHVISASQLCSFVSECRNEVWS